MHDPFDAAVRVDDDDGGDLVGLHDAQRFDREQGARDVSGLGVIASPAVSASTALGGRVIISRRRSPSVKTPASWPPA